MKRHPYGIVDPFLQVNIADSILDEIFQITKHLNIRACLTHGLCLGFVRDGGYIEGDNDLDMVVTCDEERKTILIDSLKKSGFSQGRSYGVNTHFYKFKVLVDIHFHKSEGFYSNFDNVQYKGKSYPVPSPVEQYLIAHYSNWKIKK